VLSLLSQLGLVFCPTIAVSSALIFIDNPFNSLSSSAAAGSVYIYIRKARIYSAAAAYDEG
jgi:hypothetical protein